MMPGSVSPIMMQSGINEVDRVKEMSRTQEKLESYKIRTENILPNQGPSVLPLSGVGGSPIKLAQRTNSLDIKKTINDFQNLNCYNFKASQYKETLSLNQNRGEAKI